MRHGFFADMGGVMIKPPDFPEFPVDSQQLAYLVEQGFMSMPHISHQELADRDKVDSLARILAVFQISWFTIQCIARWIQGIGLSTLELSTLAFILCTLNMYFFWFFKPVDVQSRVTLRMEPTIATVLVDAGETARRPYSQTGTVIQVLVGILEIWSSNGDIIRLFCTCAI